MSQTSTLILLAGAAVGGLLVVRSLAKQGSDKMSKNQNLAARVCVQHGTGSAQCKAAKLAAMGGKNPLAPLVTPENVIVIANHANDLNEKTGGALSIIPKAANLPGKAVSYVKGLF